MASTQPSGTVAAHTHVYDATPGPTGPKGATGATGPQGPQGIPGPAGTGTGAGVLVNPTVATVQSMLNAGQPVNFSGTCDLGTVGLTLPRDSFQIHGLGCWGLSTFAYRGSGAAIRSLDPSRFIQWGELSDFAVDISGSQPGARALEVENFFRCYYDSMYLYSGNQVRDLIRLVGAIDRKTYYNYFSRMILNTSGIAMHLTGPGSVNRNVFRDVTVDGTTGQAIVSDPTQWSNDTNLWDGLTVEGMGGQPVIDFAGSNGAKTRCNTIRNLVAEYCPNGMILRAATDGNVVEGVAPSGWVTDQGAGNVVELRS